MRPSHYRNLLHIGPPSIQISTIKFCFLSFFFPQNLLGYILNPCDRATGQSLLPSCSNVHCYLLFSSNGWEHFMLPCFILTRSQQGRAFSVVSFADKDTETEAG